MDYKPAVEALRVWTGTYAENASIGKEELRRLNLLQVKAAIAAGLAVCLMRKYITHPSPSNRE